jgi:8-oxo-dGTP pyrophosphatase MutT (NUDIX family)
MLGILGILRQNGRLLIIQRSSTVRAPLAWCFPGGEIEPGESQPAALKRELLEELNLEIEPGELLTTQTKHDGRLILYCWSARMLSPEPRPNPLEVADCAWLTPEEIRAKPGVLPGTAEILEQLGL